MALTKETLPSMFLRLHFSLSYLRSRSNSTPPDFNRARQSRLSFESKTRQKKSMLLQTSSISGVEVRLSVVHAVRADERSGWRSMRLIIEDSCLAAHVNYAFERDFFAKSGSPLRLYSANSELPIGCSWVIELLLKSRALKDEVCVVVPNAGPKELIAKLVYD
ncbi:hypothetical protein CPB83DRAFT_185667 [Crepidotus variabilis]|uniref:Uncharacterized protein n=1 Tax=Crepidotus variabilis TaxID=179855 RepID=A0A9P6EK70_9AGAR|nr:hypothetical protein CPB83DRAFT_185667 [Crepidotus variabilis]